MMFKKISKRHFMLGIMLFFALLAMLFKIYWDEFQNLSLSQVCLFLFILASGIGFVLFSFMTTWIVYNLGKRKIKKATEWNVAKIILGAINCLILFATVYYVNVLINKTISSVMVSAYVYSNNAIFTVNNYRINCTSEKNIFPDALSPLIFSRNLLRGNSHKRNGFQITYAREGVLKIEFGKHSLKFVPYKDNTVEIDEKIVKLEKPLPIFNISVETNVLLQ